MQADASVVDSVNDCLTFFRKAVPEPTAKNVHVQIGCHFEEVAEMVDAITPLEEEATELLDAAREALHNLADFLKRSGGAGLVVINVLPENRVDMLDAINDQMVTAIGSGYMLDMDVLGGFNEVNDSNLSKFGSDGEPIFDLNGKVTKGPHYRKADLTPFV